MRKVFIFLHCQRVALDGSGMRRKAPEIRKTAGHASVAAERVTCCPAQGACCVLRVACCVLSVECCVLRVACYVQSAASQQAVIIEQQCDGKEGGDAQERAHVERQRSRVCVRPHAAELRTHKNLVPSSAFQ